MSTDTDSELDLYIGAVLGKKAENVVVLDMAKLTSIADVFIICSGKSNRQVNAIAGHIQVTLKKHKIKPLSVEGTKEGHWVLLDYGHVIIHVFYQTMRDFYDLDGLWVDAGRIMTPALKKLQAEEETPEENDDM